MLSTIHALNRQDNNPLICVEINETSTDALNARIFCLFNGVAQTQSMPTVVANGNISAAYFQRELPALVSLMRTPISTFTGAS
mmetsp:Transcript_30903/g.48421  ORF Transcript_30903/g.48421 Transcript_30903/m.48421 type:complete len:83 (-) Transcript_30903:35-283(-)